MKFYSKLLGIALFGSMMGLASCSDDNEPGTNPNDFPDTEELNISQAYYITYGSDGVWDQNTVNEFFEIDDYLFSHYAEDGNYVYGFTPSKSIDTKYYDDMYAHPYTCVSGGGVAGASSPYIVGYWDIYNETQGTETTINSRTCRIYNEDGEYFMPQSVMVNNTTYMYYYGTKGNGFGGPFKNGDYVKLVAHGVHQDGSESTTSINLVEVTTDNVADGIIKTWTSFDLTPLGICSAIYFTMESNDANEYGMLAPAYFCIDKLIVKN